MNRQLTNDCYHHPELKAIVANYDGFVMEDKMKEIANKTLTMLMESKVEKVLVDTSSMKVMPKESQDWIQDDWFPRAVSAGVQKMAFVTPDNIFGEVSTKTANSAVEENDLAIDIRYFQSLNAAMAWVEEN